MWTYILTGVYTFYDGGGVYQVTPTEHTHQVRVEISNRQADRAAHTARQG